MLALFIVLGVLLFLTALLFFPLYFVFSFEESFSVRLRYLFLSFTLYPSKGREKKQQKQKRKKEKPEKKKITSTLRDIIKQEGVGGFLSILRELVFTALNLTERILHHTVIREFRLRMTIAGKDVAQTAIRFGEVCAGVYPAVGALFSRIKYKKNTIEILPDFDEEFGNGVKLYAKVRIRPYFSLIAAVAAFFRYLRLTLDRKRKEQDSLKMKEQGGAVK